MRIVRSCILAGALSAASSVSAESGELAGAVDKLRDKGFSVTSVTPIFGQLLRMGYPRGFAPIFENTKSNFYIQESVPPGESVDRWTRMITVTGMKDLATKPGATPQAVLDNMARGFQRACPSSYASRAFSQLGLGVSQAAAAVVSCGVSPTTSGKTSESALIVVVKGQTDVYTVQWAERAARSETPIDIDIPKWQDRLKALNPIRLCPIVPGEKAPYPSCVGDEKSPT